MVPLSRVERQRREWDRHQPRWRDADRAAARLVDDIRDRRPDLRNGLLDASFVRDDTSGSPPLPRLAIAGAAPLKLYLWVWWHDLNTTADPQSAAPLRAPDGAWAELLALTDPLAPANAERSIARARKTLTRQGFLTQTARNPAALTALSPTGDRSALTGERPPAYVGLPAGFWTDGWITRLSPRAITALLITMDSGPRRISLKKDNAGPRTTVLEPQLRTRYGVSRDYFHDGLAELEHRRLIDVDWERRFRARTHTNPGDTPGWSGKAITVNMATLRGSLITKGHATPSTPRPHVTDQT